MTALHVTFPPSLTLRMPCRDIAQRRVPTNSSPIKRQCSAVSRLTSNCPRTTQLQPLALLNSRKTPLTSLSSLSSLSSSTQHHHPYPSQHSANRQTSKQTSKQASPPLPSHRFLPTYPPPTRMNPSNYHARHLISQPAPTHTLLPHYYTLHLHTIPTPSTS